MASGNTQVDATGGGSQPLCDGSRVAFGMGNFEDSQPPLTEMTNSPSFLARLAKSQPSFSPVVCASVGLTDDSPGAPSVASVATPQGTRSHNSILCMQGETILCLPDKTIRCMHSDVLGLRPPQQCATPRSSSATSMPAGKPPTAAPTPTTPRTSAVKSPPARPTPVVAKPPSPATPTPVEPSTAATAPAVNPESPATPTPAVAKPPSPATPTPAEKPATSATAPAVTPPFPAMPTPAAVKPPSPASQMPAEPPTATSMPEPATTTPAAAEPEAKRQRRGAPVYQEKQIMTQWVWTTHANVSPELVPY